MMKLFKKKNNIPEKEDFERMVYHYLSRFPDTGDTIEGIMNWWLTLDRSWHDPTEIEVILENLLKKGFIRMHTASDNKIYYRVSKKI